MNLPASAGMSVWAMGYTQNETKILHAFECFVEVSEDENNGSTFLSLVTVDHYGNVNPVIVSGDEDGEDGKTIIFLADTKSQIFDIELVKTIRTMFYSRVALAIDYRVKEGLSPEDIFYVVQKPHSTTD